MLEPQGDFTWSSALPFERNDGAVWAGRGLTIHATGGVRASCGPLRIQLAPDLWFAQNRDFAFVGFLRADRSGFAHPYLIDDLSADIPTRPGGASVFAIDPGQSAIELDAGPVTIAATTQSEWWGPAIRNAIVMSNHAAGIPRLTLQPRAPVRTSFGILDARWILGMLVESPYFDFDDENDVRAVSGAVLTLGLAADTNLSVGVARVVFSSVTGVSSLPARALDVFVRWGDAGDGAPDGFASQQLTSIFGRWVFPGSGFEAYGEWARVRLSPFFRGGDPFSDGHTLGVQWVGESGTAAWRILSEFTNLERRRPQRHFAPLAFYTSAAVPQGFTQRGQSIGAMIGPGASSQWMAVDRLEANDRSAGVFAGRVRWANDAYFRSPNGRGVWSHDVSLFGGGRTTFAMGQLSATAELTGEQRLNYHFQSPSGGSGEDRLYDVRNLTLRIAVQRARVTGSP